MLKAFVSGTPIVSQKVKECAMRSNNRVRSHKPPRPSDAPPQPPTGAPPAMRSLPAPGRRRGSAGLMRPSYPGRSVSMPQGLRSGGIQRSVTSPLHRAGLAAQSSRAGASAGTARERRARERGSEGRNGDEGKQRRGGSGCARETKAQRAAERERGSDGTSQR